MVEFEQISFLIKFIELFIDFCNTNKKWKHLIKTRAFVIKLVM